MKLEQMTIFDLLAEMKHDWKKVPDEASVRISGFNVINVIDSGIKKEENIEFAIHGFVNNERCWIGCVSGSNGETIPIMYADDLNKDESDDLLKKEEQNEL